MRGHSPSARAAAWLLWAIAFVATASTVLFRPAWLLTFEPDERYGLYADFVLHYLPAARTAWEGGGSVEWFLYPPLAVTLLVPFAWLEPDTAIRAWVLCSLAATLALALAPLPPGTHQRHTAVLAWLTLLSVPVWHSLRWGQVSVFLTAGALWGCAWLIRSRTYAGSMLVVVSAFAKLYPLLLFPVLWAAGQLRWRAVAIAAAGCTLLPVLLLGPAQALAWSSSAVATLADASRGFMALNSNSQLLVHVVGRVLPGEALRVAAGIIGIGGGVTTLALCARVAARAPRAVWLALAVAWLTVPLLITPSWPHYFAFLPWVSVVLAERLMEPDTGYSPRGWELPCWGAAVILQSVAGLALAGDWRIYAHTGFIAVATLLLLGTGLRQLVLQLRHPSLQVEARLVETGHR